MTPAEKALLAFAEAWTYPMIANEDLAVLEPLFSKARTLANDVVVGAEDAPEFAEWLEILGDEERANTLEWEDTLQAVTDYFGLSRDMKPDDGSERIGPAET